MLLKQSKLRETSIQHSANHYGWLSSRSVQNEASRTNKDLERLRPMIQKVMTLLCLYLFFYEFFNRLTRYATLIGTEFC